ncbi:MAG: hypothetical protein A2605_04135 [Candidatus Zambryskibacteria bacterium RIFOXYD1_FULL_39_35]|nr:MAG: hypothetical protein A2605_04135 [Candidatus Zambryskibacteria bacterium RIFOXYD1_FULL_39_35]
MNDTVAERLKSFGLDDSVISMIGELGVETETDLSSLTEGDLTGAGVKKIPARKIIAALAPAPSTPEPVAGAVAAVSFDSVLPAVPTDASWLEALRTGGVLKVDQSSVISAIRVALAYKAGLYEIPDGLVRLMENFADSNDEQVDPVFFKLRKQITRRSYGEIFEAIDGLDGSYVTDARKKQLFVRVDQHLWPSIVQFYDQLRAWQEAWMQGAANPAMMMNAILASSGGGMSMPPGMMQPPDTGVLRDHADAVNDALNRVFAGTGVQIAAALAYEASRIKEALEDPRLPALTGAANRDQMLKMLKVAVSATYPRLETNLTRFVLAVMRAKDQAAGNEEIQYFSALFMLGSQIPWSQMSGLDVTVEVHRPNAKSLGSGLGRVNTQGL